MPATYAHYRFGKAVYKRLPEELRQMIKENKEAYLIGLHGPDLLFYYRPLGKNRVNRTGSRMHRETALSFFERARERYREKPSYVLLSYLCGFLCHFVLDSECHPYIGSYMEEHGISHGDIETDFDRYLMEEDGLDPVRHNCTRHLIRDLDTEEAIASVLEDITAEQVDDSILGFRFCIGALQCPSGKKERILRGIFGLLGQEESLGSLIMTGRPHPACEESRVFLRERLERAAAVAEEMIRDYAAKIADREPLSERLDRDFE